MKVCIIGSNGHWGYAANAIKKDNDITVNGIAPGIDGEDISKLIKEYDKAVHYSNYIEMLDKEKPDITVINSYFYLNSHIAIEVIDRGINVFIEKPIAISINDLNKVKEKYYKSDVNLMTMLGIRYTPWFLTAKKVVAEGHIGDVRLLQAQKSYKLGNRPNFYKNRDTYGGTIPWVGSHAIDWIRWIGEVDFNWVCAAQSNECNRNNEELEVSAVCQFGCTKNVYAQVILDYFRPQSAPTHDDDRIRIVGTDGIVEVRNKKVYLLENGSEQNIELLLESEGNIFSDFINQIRGHGKCMVSAEDSFYITEVCLKARESADTGTIIKI